jgi:hypothetical protein
LVENVRENKIWPRAGIATAPSRICYPNRTARRKIGWFETSLRRGGVVTFLITNTAPHEHSATFLGSQLISDSTASCSN